MRCSLPTRTVTARTRRTLASAPLIFFGALLAACGGDSAGPAPPPPPPPNRAPTIVGTLPAVELAVGETETLDASQLLLRSRRRRAQLRIGNVERSGGHRIGIGLDVDRPRGQGLTVREEREWTGSGYFADPDGDALIYTAGTTNASIVLAMLSGGDFGIVAVAPGMATVTVAATDGDGLSARRGSRSGQESTRRRGRDRVGAWNPAATARR